MRYGHPAWLMAPALILVVGACTPKVPPSPPGPPLAAATESESRVATEEPATVVVGTTDKVTDLDPATSYDFHTWELHNATMSGLLMYTPEGVTVPSLAAALPVPSADALTWTVSLKRGLRFPSGRELTAEDVVWSIERVLRLAGKSSWFVTSFLQEVKVLDPHTVAFVLQQPTSFFPSLLAVPAYFPLDQTCYAADELQSDSTCGGLGRYLIREWRRDEKIVLEANPSWPGEPPAAPRIVIRYFDDSGEMRQSLESGSIDVAWNTLTPQDIGELRRNEAIRVWDGPSNFKRMLIFTHTMEPFDDRRVRQAFSYILDREQIAEQAFQGLFRPLYSPVPDSMHGHLDTLPRTDVARGVELLTEAGFSQENPLTFELWWTTDHYGSREGELARVIKQQLEAAGIVEITLRGAEWDLYVEKTSDCAYPVYLLGWYPDYLDPSTTVDFFAFSQATPDLCSNYSNPEMDRLIRAAQSEADTALREEHYRRIQELWRTELPTLPLVQGLQTAASRLDIGDVVIDASGMLRYELLSP